MCPEELKSSVMSAGKLPDHIAIIMDGNGRWARKRGLLRTAGHRAGVKTVKKIVRIAGEIGLKYLTLFTFSTENWKRPKTEVTAIMRLLEQTTRKELSELLENNVRLIATGNIENLPPKKREVLLDAIERTKNNTGLVLNLALSYSGRAEIIQAIKNIAADISSKKIKPEDLNDQLFSSYLQTNGLPDPDLLIRTSGEMRISNFLLWQTAYTELYVTDILWPDFTEEDFLKAIADYQRRDRRFGMVSSSKK
ncbi:MAG: isoprenyl transferase [Candidatus Zixiibacteriota bacterium]|nr:MAG: isoprenyl transferase [candidate division Zixibacteria bacterium]